MSNVVLNARNPADGAATIPVLVDSTGRIVTTSGHASDDFANADVDTLETIATIDVKNGTRLYVSFVVGVANLSDFNVDFRVDAAASYFTVATAAANYTTPIHPVLLASGDLASAAFGATTHWLLLDVTGIESVRLQAAGTSSTVTGYYGLG